RAGQAQRVLRVRRIEVVADQFNAPAAVQVPVQARVEPGAPGLAVVAVAVAVEYRGREVVAGAGGGAAQARASGQVAMAAGGRTQVQARLWSAVGAPQLDHATGGIAVERRERSEEHTSELQS